MASWTLLQVKTCFLQFPFLHQQSLALHWHTLQNTIPAIILSNGNINWFLCFLFIGLPADTRRPGAGPEEIKLKCEVSSHLKQILKYFLQLEYFMVVVQSWLLVITLLPLSPDPGDSVVNVVWWSKYNNIPVPLTKERQCGVWGKGVNEISRTFSQYLEKTPTNMLSLMEAPTSTFHTQESIDTLMNGI